MPSRQQIQISCGGIVIHGYRLSECDKRSTPAVCILPGLTIVVNLN